MTRYSKDHLWIRENERGFRIGLTDFAQNELGEIAYIELPEIGSHVDVDEPLGSLDSLKSSSDLYAPFAGTVVEVNNALETEGAARRINDDPEGEGWVVLMKPDREDDLQGLMSEVEYAAFVGA